MKLNLYPKAESARTRHAEEREILRKLGKAAAADRRIHGDAEMEAHCAEIDITTRYLQRGAKK